MFNFIFKNKKSCHSLENERAIRCFLIFFMVFGVILFKNQNCYSRVDVAGEEGGGGGDWSRDTTPPTTPLVFDDGNYTTRSNRLHSIWSCSDPESGIAEYKYGIGTTPGAVDLVGWTSVGLINEGTRYGLNLTEGQSYYISVKAKNANNLWSTPGNSDGIIVDTQPPQGAIIINNGQQYINSITSSLTLSANDSISGVVRMKFSNDGLTWSAAETFNSNKVWTLSQDFGKKTVYVKFKDNAGNWSGPFSDEIFLIREPPKP